VLDDKVSVRTNLLLLDGATFLQPSYLLCSMFYGQFPQIFQQLQLPLRAGEELLSKGFLVPEEHLHQVNHTLKIGLFEIEHTILVAWQPIVFACSFG